MTTLTPEDRRHRDRPVTQATTSRRARWVLPCVLLGVSVLAAWSLFGPPTARRAVVSPTTASATSAAARVQAAMAKLPIYFAENQGQEDARVRYAVRGREANVYFTGDGVTFSLRDPEAKPVARPSAIDQRVRRVSRSAGPPELTTASTDGATSRWTMKLEFIGANPKVTPRGRDATPAVISQFTGPRSQWKTGIRTYGAVVYEELWPGIDMVYDGAEGRLKYTFLLKPGADPSRIRLAYRGSSEVSVTDAGELKIVTPVGRLSEAAPYSYQEMDGRRVEVATSYAVTPSRTSDPAVVGFRVGAYDTSRPLVVDPATFVYVGYIGGSSYDEGTGIAVDSAGNAYVTGYTESTVPSFPAQVGPELVHAGRTDAFVVKIKADGTGLAYAGYIGGSESELSHGIAVDLQGNAYVVGKTFSDATTFPVTVGPSLVGGGGDTFVAKVSADGTTLVYCGYISGAHGYAIAVDASGQAYIAGAAGGLYSGTFPATVGPSLTLAGEYDAFVAKVAADGTALVYAGYIGGAASEHAYGIAVDSTGHAYVVGQTRSDQTTFPALVGPRLAFGGDEDAFIAKVKPDGTGLVYAGYIGGSAGEAAFGVAVDLQGNAYVTGRTASSAATFPVTVGPSLVYTGGVSDAFVAKVRPDGSGFAYAGYIGGANIDVGSGIAVDQAGNAYVAGWTASDESTFPVRGGPLLMNPGRDDAFVAKVRADGGGLAYAGYIGGADTDHGHAIAIDSAGNAYVAGSTWSTSSSFPVQVGPDFVHGGAVDAFVAKISGGGSGPDLLVTAVSDPPALATIGSSFSVSVTVQNQGLTNANGSQTRFYLSADAVKSGDDVQLTGVRSVGTLVPGATATGNANLTVPMTAMTGTFFFLACADGAEAVTESEETNNCGVAAVGIEIGLADLVVSALSHTGRSFLPGDRISATDTTENRGRVATDDGTATRFYLSADATKSADDRRLIGSHSVGNLQAGATSHATTMATIPDATTPGVYFLLACADDTTQVDEADELNNCAASSNGQVAVGMPNLTATLDSLTVTGSLQPGQTFQVQDTTRNDSATAITVATTTRYLLSLDQARSANDVSVDTRTVAALAGGATSSAQRTVTIPATIALGQYFVLVCADDAGVVVEGFETDNCAASTVRVTVTRPDLIEQAVTAGPAIVFPGQAITVSDTTRNQGSVAAPASTTRYYLSLDPLKSANDWLLGGTTARPALPPGGSIGSTRAVTVPAAVPPGQYFVLACADDGLVVTETNETNNCTPSSARIGVTQ